MKLHKMHKFLRAQLIKASENYFITTTGARIYVYDKKNYNEIMCFEGLKNCYNFYITKDEKNIIASGEKWEYMYFLSMEDEKTVQKIKVTKGRDYINEGEFIISQDEKYLYASIIAENCTQYINVIDINNKTVIDKIAYDEKMFINDGVWYDNNDYYFYWIKDGKKEKKLLEWWHTIGHIVLNYYYDGNNILLYVSNTKGIYIIDMKTKKVVDYIRKETAFQFLYMNNCLYTYDEKGVLYEIEKYVEIEELPQIDINLEETEYDIFTDEDFTIDEDILNKFAELREKFNIKLYYLDEKNRNELISDVSKMQEIGMQYKDSYDELYANNTKSIKRIEYASLNGITLPFHRGYYCPSIIIDYIFGKSNRGKLLKRLTSKTVCYYKYYFDDSNNLVLVEKYSNDICIETEFIIKIDNIVYGLTYLLNNNICNLELLSMEKYDRDNKLLRYIENVFDSKQMNYNTYLNYGEQYDYSDENPYNAMHIEGNIANEKCEMVPCHLQK